MNKKSLDRSVLIRERRDGLRSNKGMGRRTKGQAAAVRSPTRNSEEAFFGIATLGVHIPANIAAVIALVVNVGAYTCEIVRAGIESVHKSQLEAAECLGLSRLQIYWHVILRPAIERVYPALTSQYVLLMLASSITSQISAEELTAVANRIQSNTFRSFETYIVTGILYLLLSLVVRVGLWGFGMAVFVRRRRLGTTL